MMPSLDNRAAFRHLLRACCLFLATLHAAWAGPPERLSLDAGWRFLQGDVPLPTIKGQGASYMRTKAGEAQGPANADYDDSGWRHVELQLDGVATHSTVWVNGIVVNRNWSGYNGRYIDITPYVRYGTEVNTIAVRVDAEVRRCRHQ